MPLTAIAAASACLVSGLALGFGAGTAAFLGLALAAVMFQTLFESKKTVLSGVFTAVMLAVGFIFMANQSLSGLVGWFGAFSPGKYQFDIGYEFYEEIKEAPFGFWRLLYTSHCFVPPSERLKEASWLKASTSTAQ